MKICPRCNNTYIDDSLQFCSRDGSALIVESAQQYDTNPVTLPLHKESQDSNASDTIAAKYVFLDVVRFTHDRSVEAQAEIVRALNDIVKLSVGKFKIPEDNVRYIPTGDGICIALLNVESPLDIHIQVALEILVRIKVRNETTDDPTRQFHVRIGINSNIDNVVEDINGQPNVAGAGISMAARIMGMADGDQILVGQSVYDTLRWREKYASAFRSYRATVKHGLAIDVYQLVSQETEGLSTDTPRAFSSAEDKVELSKQLVTEKEKEVAHSDGGQTASEVGKQQARIKELEEEIRRLTGNEEYLSRELLRELNTIKAKYKWLFDLAGRDQGNIETAVIVTSCRIFYHLSEVPHIDFRFNIFNGSVFAISIEESVKGYIGFRQQRLMGTREMIENRAQNILPRGTGYFVVRQEVSTDRAKMIDSSAELVFNFDSLIINLRGGDSYPEVETKELVLPYSEVINNRGGHDPTLALKYQEIFDSDAMAKNRIAAAESLKKALLLPDEVLITEIDRRTDNVLDLFEDIGFYMHHGAVSPEIAHHHFYHWARGYWDAANRYRQQMRRSEGRALWEYFAELIRRVSEVEAAKERCEVEELALSTSEINKFLDDETGIQRELDG